MRRRKGEKSIVAAFIKWHWNKRYFFNGKNYTSIIITEACSGAELSSQQSRLTRTRRKSQQHGVRVNSWISKLSLAWINVSFLLSLMNVSIDFSNDLSYLLSKHCSPVLVAQSKKNSLEFILTTSFRSIHESNKIKTDCFQSAPRWTFSISSSFCFNVTSPAESLTTES